MILNIFTITRDGYLRVKVSYERSPAEDYGKSGARCHGFPLRLELILGQGGKHCLSSD